MSKKAPPPSEPVPDHPLARCIPRDDRVIIRRKAKAPETPCGLVLPETSAKPFDRHLGTVWAVGPGRRKSDGTRVPTELKKGDEVVVLTYSGLDLHDAGDPMSPLTDSEFLIVRESEVLGVIPAC